MNADKHLVFIGFNRCSSAAICSSHILSERLPSCAGSRRLRLFAKCGDPVLQRPQANPQHLASALAVPAHVLQGEFDVSLVDFHERLARLKHHSTIQVRRLPGRAAGTYPEGGGRKIRQPDKTLASHDGGSFQRIAQLPHVTRPIVPMEQIQHFGIDSRNARPMWYIQVPQHHIRDRRNIFFMLSQRRNQNLEYTQPSTLNQLLRSSRRSSSYGST